MTTAEKNFLRRIEESVSKGITDDEKLRLFEEMDERDKRGQISVGTWNKVAKLLYVKPNPYDMLREDPTIPRS